jgi:hypothetical protein
MILCGPPLLLVLAMLARSGELLIVAFLVTILGLAINSLLSLGLLLLWFTSVTNVSRAKPLLMAWAGVLTDVVILWLMPPLAK